MSSRSTLVPSRAQRYCCFSREPQPLWIQLKETLAEVSAVEYIWIGTVTRPKEIDAEAIGLAAIVSQNLRTFGSGQQEDFPKGAESCRGRGSGADSFRQYRHSCAGVHKPRELGFRGIIRLKIGRAHV